METCQRCNREVAQDELVEHLYGHLHQLEDILDWTVKDTLPRVRHQVTELFEHTLNTHRKHSPVFEDLCCRLVTDDDILYTVLTQARWFRLEDEDVPLKDQEPL